jgi:hypothetical protein
MLPDGAYTAVLDRIEDGLAAFEVTVGDDRREIAVPVDRLPTAARRVDSVVTVEIVDGAVETVEHDPAATAARAQRAQDRFDQLSERLPDDTDS